MSDIMSAGVLAAETARRMKASSSVIGSSAGRIEMLVMTPCSQERGAKSISPIPAVVVVDSD
jgi:hypothetical protein